MTESFDLAVDALRGAPIAPSSPSREAPAKAPLSPAKARKHTRGVFLTLYFANPADYAAAPSDHAGWARLFAAKAGAAIDPAAPPYSVCRFDGAGVLVAFGLRAEGDAAALLPLPSDHGALRAFLPAGCTIAYPGFNPHHGDDTPSPGGGDLARRLDNAVGLIRQTAKDAREQRAGERGTYLSGVHHGLLFSLGALGEWTGHAYGLHPALAGIQGGERVKAFSVIAASLDGLAS